MRLSILDQSTVVSGRSPDESIRETLALARHCDALGYDRYWVSEHHSSESVAGSAPEVLMAAIAATTRRIRVGSAGIMLPHYAALKVAEQFRVLEAIAPGRIDLGVGRAPGSDGLTAQALNPNAAMAAEHFPAQLRDLMAWTQDHALPDRHPFRSVRAQPTGPGAPEIWVLGSSDYGAQVAAHFGLPYCFAHFFTDGGGAEQALGLYRHLYKPSERHPQPHAAICVWALACDTEAEAERQFTARAVWRLGRDRGVYAPLPSPEEARAFLVSDGQQARIAHIRASAVIGTGAQVAASLHDMAEALGAHEVAVITTTHDPDIRRRSYTLLADAVGLRTGFPLAAE